MAHPARVGRRPAGRRPLAKPVVQAVVPLPGASAKDGCLLWPLLKLSNLPLVTVCPFPGEASGWNVWIARQSELPSEHWDLPPGQQPVGLHTVKAVGFHAARGVTACPFRDDLE